MIQMLILKVSTCDCRGSVLKSYQMENNMNHEMGDWACIGDHAH